MDLLIAPLLFSAPFLLASLVRRAAKDIFPTWECFLLGVYAVAGFYFWIWIM